MMDTKIHGMEYTRDLLEHATTPIATRGQRPEQPSPRVPSLQLHLRAVPIANETPPDRNDSMRSLQSHTKILSKRSSDIFKVDKYYIGLLQQLPPPKEVQDKWDRDIRPNLEQHLCQATRMLSKSLRDEDVITEPVLCMAGKRFTPTSLSSESLNTSSRDLVALSPIIWIHCGSRKCKKKVVRATSTLSYVKHFEGSFSMQPLHASLQAPWPAALGSLSTRSDDGDDGFSSIQVSLDIQIPKSQRLLISGAKARFTVRHGPTFTEQFCTIGGLIKVENQLYAITTAHPLLNAIKKHTAFSKDSDHDTSSDDSDVTSSDSGTDQSDIRHRRAKQAHESMLPSTTTGKWVNLPRPIMLSYLGKATSDGKYGLPRSISTVSDFALIAIEDASQFIDAESSVSIPNKHIPTSNLSGGEVLVIANDGLEPLKGNLLDGIASIILRGEVIRTRKVQMKHPGKRGWSGSWVVRDEKLCGMIYAAYDHTPYLHMLPIEDVFRGIRELLNTNYVGVADLSEIRRGAPNAVVSDGATGTHQRRGRNQKLPITALNKLQAWLFDHSDNPYPSSQEKRQLAEDCHLTDKQVTTWLTNARARQLPPSEIDTDDESGDESAYDSEVQASTYANTDLTSFSENQHRYRSVLGVLSRIESQPSRRGKKKEYRSAQRLPENELTTPDSAISDIMSPALGSPNTMPEQEMWQCTFCFRYLVPKSWRRHEETQHRPKATWTCMLHGPRVSLRDRPTTNDTTSICAFCMAKNPSEDHFLCNHRISECAKRPTSERTYFRPDHLRQHIKNFHSATLYDVVQTQWKKAPEVERDGAAGWTCGFCAAHLETWDTRETHIANHFKDGMTMDQWVQGGSIKRAESKKGKQGKDHQRFDFARNSHPLTTKARVWPPQAPGFQAQPPKIMASFSNQLGSSYKDGRVSMPEIDIQFQGDNIDTTTSAVPPSGFKATLDNVLGYGENEVD